MSPRPDDPSSEGGPAADPEEIELKLAVGQPAVIRALICRPPAGGIAGFTPIGPARRVTCVDRYFDTAAIDGQLRLGGVRARLREQAGGVTLAVKLSITSDGAVSRRVELQGPAIARLDPASWPASDARARVMSLLGDRPIVEIAALRQRRLQRDFMRDDTTVEISLDHMSALDGARILDSRTEVEAELLSGDAALLHEISEDLQILPGVSPAAGSKLAFALAARASRPAELPAS